MKLENNRLIKALLRQPTDRTPIWVMRQAGRYLPEYREVRAKAGNFMNLCRNPELASEVTMQPLARFDLDAAILFSDILTIPDAMGLGLYFSEGEGPKFERPLQSISDIKKLIIPAPERELRYVMDAVSLIRKRLNNKVPLIGFAGSPWTLACYMVEGGASRDFKKIKALMYQEPKSMHLLLRKLTEALISYLNGQIASGAQVVMLFDTWGGILSTPCYKEFSLNYMHEIFASLQQEAGGFTVPRILFTKNGGQWLESMKEVPVHALGLDWTTDIGQAFNRVGDKFALQGNLDPAILLTSPSCIEQEVSKILASFGNKPGHVFNLGHGITPDVPIENMQALVESVKRLSKRYHQI